MTHTSTEQERAEFEAWKEDYALTFEPNYDEHLEADCKAAFLAGMQAARRAQVAAVISEAQVLAITTAYEQGVGKGHQSHDRKEAITNPYGDEWSCDSAWQMGYDEGREQAERKAAAPQWDGVIKPSDFIVNTFRSGGSGWVPRPDIRVRIIHRPTGFFEEENAMRSAHANKAVAWQRLSDRLESLAATPQPPEAVPVVSDAQIKAVFLANGFTIKEGMTDLKPYVYQAARALLAEVSAPTAPQAVLGWVHELKNGKLGSKFYTYEPHCDNAVRDDGGKKIAVAAPAAQGGGCSIGGIH